MHRQWAKQIGFEYAEFVLYSFAPACGPLAIVAAADGVNLLDKDALLLFVGAEQLFLLAVGLCGTLMLRTTRIERDQDRRVMHGPLVLVLLAASLGLGLARAGYGDDPDFLRQFAGALVLVLVGFGGVGTAVLANRKQRRRPIIDLRSKSPNELAGDLNAILLAYPEVEPHLDALRVEGVSTGGDPGGTTSPSSASTPGPSATQEVP